MDETGHSFRARLGTTWAPVGQTPVLERLSRRREVSSIVAVTAPLDGQSPRLLARHFVGGIKKERVIDALAYFQRRLNQPLVIIWDHLPAHRSRVVQQFIRSRAPLLRMEWLPAYAPDLNPEEGCNGIVKEDMRNAAPNDIEELRRMARRSFRRLQRRPQVLRSFFTGAGLHV